MFARGKRQAAALVKGPRANAFPTEMWTLAQVAEVIETVTGVRYSQTQTWTILREPLGVEPAASGAAGDRA
jgi:transposase